MNQHLLVVCSMVALGLLAVVSARKSIDTLVVVENAQIKESHSQFLASLTARGHTVEVQDISEPIHLAKYGKFYYDNLVLFAPTAEEFSGTISTQSILEFIDAGHNVLVAASANVSTPIRELANECGVDFDDENTMVIDHGSFDSKDSGDRTLIASSEFISSAPILGAAGISAPVLFRGIGQAVNPDSSLVARVLTGSRSAYSFTPNTVVADAPQSASTETVLVSAVQTRSNGRVVFAGSLQLFSNEFFNAAVNLSAPFASSSAAPHFAKSGNEQFCGELSKWNFRERGVLRATEFTHRKADANGEVNPASYRVKDMMDVSVKIEEYSHEESGWIPFTGNDVQLELVMLDPYVRTFLKHNGKGLYTLRFQVPDVYGVFKFRLSYHRLGWSNIDMEEKVSVRPFRHDEFERFIGAAFPYYASAFSMMAGFFLFGIVFLYHRDSAHKQH